VTWIINLKRVREDGVHVDDTTASIASFFHDLSRAFFSKPFTAQAAIRFRFFGTGSAIHGRHAIRGKQKVVHQHP
jgi:hypothetical protein